MTISGWSIGVGAYLDFVNSTDTQAAMKNDGVRRDTLEVIVIDKAMTN